MAWSFVGKFTSTSVASGSLTLTEPAGVTEGDLLVACITIRGTTGFDTPSGWTKIDEELTGNTTVGTTGSISSGQWFYIVRGASAPALAFTRTGGDLGFGTIAAYRTNVLGGQPTLDQFTSTTPAAASTTPTTASGITPTTNDQLLMVFVAGATNNGISGMDAASYGTAAGATNLTTDPSTSVWSKRDGSSTATGADGGVGIGDIVMSTAAATGTFTASVGASARHAIFAASFSETGFDASASVTGVASTGSVGSVTVSTPTHGWDFTDVATEASVTSGNLTLNEPPGTAQGDLLIAYITIRGTTGFNTPTGWTKIGEQLSGNTDVGLSTSISSGQWFYIIRGASAPALTFTRTGGNMALGNIVGYRDALGGTITLDQQTSTTPGAASTTPTTASGFTPSANNALLVVFCANACNSGTSSMDAASYGTAAGTTNLNTAPDTATWQKRSGASSATGEDGGVGVGDIVMSPPSASGTFTANVGISNRSAIFAAAFVTTVTASVSVDATGVESTGSVGEVAINTPQPPWSFVAKSTAVAVASGDLTLTEPAGAAAGDLLVAYITIRSTVGFATPSGWTKIDERLNANVDASLDTSSSGGAWYWIVRGASAPALTWTRTGGDLGYGGIIAYRSSAGGTIGLDAFTSATPLATTLNPQTDAGLTPTGNNQLVLIFCANARNNGTSLFDAELYGEPSGATNLTVDPSETTWTKREGASTATGADGGIGIGDIVVATAQDTGRLTASTGATSLSSIFAASFKDEVVPGGEQNVSVAGVQATTALGEVTAGGVVAETPVPVTGVQATGSVGNARARVGTASRFLPSQRSGTYAFGCLYGNYLWHYDCMEAWSLTTGDNERLDFELRPGDVLDRRPTNSYFDPITSERTELGGDSGGDQEWITGQTVTVEYDFLVPSGFDFNTAWCVVGQMHANTPTTPPFEFAFRNGNTLNALYAIKKTGASSNPQEQTFAITKNAGGTAIPIVRDVWHNIVLRYRQHSSTGLIQIIYDGVEVVNFNGQVGYTDQTYGYWRFGIYRRSTGATYRCSYKNWRLGATPYTELLSIPTLNTPKGSLGTPLVSAEGGVPDNDVPATGTGTTTSVGTVSAGGDANVSPTGVQTEGHVGTVGTEVGGGVSVSLDSLQATGSVGEVSVTGSDAVDVSVDITGFSVATALGDITTIAEPSEVSVDVFGVQAEGQVGQVFVPTPNQGARGGGGGGNGGPSSPHKIEADERESKKRQDRRKRLRDTIEDEADRIIDGKVKKPATARQTAIAAPSKPAAKPAKPQSPWGPLQSGPKPTVQRFDPDLDDEDVALLL